MLGVLGYTDHSIAHTSKVAYVAENILQTLGFSQREAELAKIASYMHDIGNTINRTDHSLTGAVMAFTILSKLDMPPEEIAIISSAIGNHDEQTGISVTPVSAALIIADKTDVRRSRVRNQDFNTFDIHDRVNYAVDKSELIIDKDNRTISLLLNIDTKICSLMDYFEIFIQRMVMCKNAAEFLKADFELKINEVKLI